MAADNVNNSIAGILLRHQYHNRLLVMILSIMLIWIILSKKSQIQELVRRIHSDFLNDLAHSTFPSNQGWKVMLTDLNEQPGMLVYSSYHYQHDTNVTIIAQRRLGFPGKIYCRLRFKENASIWTTAAHIVYSFSVGFKKATYKNAIVFCPVPHKLWPVEVALVMGEQISPYLPIQNGSLQRKWSHILCLSAPLHNHTDYIMLIEFFEMHKQLGVTKIIVYTSFAGDIDSNKLGSKSRGRPVSPEMWAVLRHYQQEGLVDLYNWDLIDILGWDAIVDGGQIALINDCIYRYKFKADYTAVYDLDELLVPQGTVGTHTWAEMMTSLQLPKQKAEIMFQSRIFQAKHKCSPPALDKISHNNVTAYMTYSVINKRLEKFVSPTFRAKAVYRTDTVIVALVHKSHSLVPGYHAVLAPMSVGYIHHYRKNLPPKLASPPHRWKHTNELAQYKSNLLEAIGKTLSHLQTIK